jgi:phosphatidate cytidylyltransferase
VKTRVITGLVIIVAMVAVLFLSTTPVFPITLAVLSVIAIKEVFSVHSLGKNAYLTVPCYVAAAAMPPVAYFLRVIRAESETGFIMILAAVIVVLMMYVLGVSVFAKGKIPYSTFASAFVMVAYIMVSFSAICLIRFIIDDTIGLFCLGLVLIGAWVSDVFAYFTGVLFGKHKLIPEVSPKKTVEGSIGAIVFTTIATVLLGLIGSAITGVKANYLVLALSGPVLSVAGQIGDLFASIVKREHGVKDYGNLLPGHGGIMDRFDSILATSITTLVITLLFTPFSW